MNTRNYRKALGILLFGLALVGLAFAGSQTETASGAKEMTLAPVNIGTLDPAANWVYDMASSMFVPLVEYDYVESEVVPAGATSWDVSADGRTWTFDIRRNWNWSNGNPITAYDYEYTFQTIVNPETLAPTSWRLFIIENASAVNSGEMSVDSLGVKALDDYTLEIKITEPAAWFLSSLTSIGHVVPKDVREQYGVDWTQPENIAVSGPYKLMDFEEDNFYILEKNPNYFDADSVDIEKITLLDIPEASTRMAMYENDEIDTTDVPAEDLDRVKNDSDLSKEFYTGPRFVLYWYAFDSSRPPFDNVLVRKAFAAAIDKQTIVEQITRGGQVAAPTMTPPGSVGSVPLSVEIGIPFDQDQAQAYLAEAGFPGGEGLAPIVLGYNASEINTNVAQAIQKMWNDNLGVAVELKGWDGAGYGDASASGAFNVWRNGWGMDFPDAHNVLGEIFRSKPVTGDQAHQRLLPIAEFDQIVDAAAVETDPAKRNDMYINAERILVEEYVSAMPIYWYATNRVTKPRLNRLNVPSFSEKWWLWTIDE